MMKKLFAILLAVITLHLATAPAQAQKGMDFQTSLRLAAVLVEGGAPLRKGVIWSIFEQGNDGATQLVKISESREGQPIVRLSPGAYMINAAYGRASVTRRVMVGAMSLQEIFVLNAGGLKLGVAINGRTITSNKLTFTVQAGMGASGPVVMEDAPASQMIRLPAGDYSVLSRYGDTNAIQQSDVRVRAGQITEVTVNHRAASITLKLVKDSGGEALADTSWSILTPGGDSVKESIGAFPSMVLAEGEYSVVARNEGRTFTSTFKVESGRDREVEVLAK